MTLISDRSVWLTAIAKKVANSFTLWCFTKELQKRKLNIRLQVITLKYQKNKVIQFWVRQSNWNWHYTKTKAIWLKWSSCAPACNTQLPEVQERVGARRQDQDILWYWSSQSNYHSNHLVFSWYIRNTTLTKALLSHILLTGLNTTKHKIALILASGIIYCQNIQIHTYRAVRILVYCKKSLLWKTV